MYNWQATVLEKVILKIVQRHTEDRGLLNASQFGFRARHSTTLQCMMLTHQATLNSNNFSGCGIFGYTIWRLGLLYIISKQKFSISLFKHISSFLAKEKFSVMVEGCRVPSRNEHAITENLYTEKLYNFHSSST
jgi:hypothetical protein